MKAVLLTTMCASALAAGATNASAELPSSVSNPRSPANIEDIVVTASRRSESVRKTPTAVSAYSGSALRDAQIASLPDLVGSSPNIQISTYGSNSNIAIRGIGNTQIVGGADPGVALHVDGVYLGQSALATATFLDVNRVEILRGPQGTLFGRNATGGAINILPNRPTAEFEGGFDLSLGFDPTMAQSSAYLSGPLSDDRTLLARVAVQQHYNRGYTKNLAPSGPGHLDGQTTYSGRGQLEWAPSPFFTLRASLEHAREKDNGAAFFFFGNPDPSLPLPVEIAGQPGGDPDQRKAYANQGKRDLKATTAILVGEWRVGAGDLKATYSYNRTKMYQALDGDATPVDFTSTAYDQHARQHYGELIYSSDGTLPFSYVLGANGFREDFVQRLSVPISFLPSPVALFGDISTRSYAVFAHAQYKLTEQMKLFGGLRYSHDQKSIDESNNFIGAGSNRASWSRVTYEVGAAYDFNQSVSGYAKYATGYKGGGFSLGGLSAPFDPETNSNLEIGLKGTYLGGLLQANLAAFHMKYDDLQVSQVIGVVSSIVNAAKATIDGLEAEVTIKPTQDIRLQLSGAYLYAKFNSFFTQDSSRPTFQPDCVVQNGIPQCGIELAGNGLPQSPRFTLSSGAYYDMPVSSGAVTFGARYDWKSRFYFTEFNLPVTGQKAAGTLDLTVQYKSEDGSWTAGLFARNVADKAIKSQAYVNSALLGSLALGQLKSGRQLGASIGHRF